MPAILSEARLLANQQNAQKSTGPRTAAGKKASRQNAVKHGLTGAGVALPLEEAAEVEGRFQAIQGELAPRTVLGAYFAHQVALMTVRTQRAARHETVALTRNIRRAGEEFDAARRTKVHQMFARLEREPNVRRQLLALPEGVERLAGALLGLRRDLSGATIRWAVGNRRKIAVYCGPHGERGACLAMAIDGDFSALDPSEYDHLESHGERQTWAADQLIDLIDAEVALLRAHHDTLDHDAIARDRAEAEELALFDPSPEATLARRYEAASTRALHHALREFRAVEADDEPAAASPQGEIANPDRDASDPLEPDDTPPTSPIEPDEGEAADYKSPGDNDLATELGSFGNDVPGDDEPGPLAVVAGEGEGVAGSCCGGAAVPGGDWDRPGGV